MPFGAAVATLRDVIGERARLAVAAAPSPRRAPRRAGALHLTDLMHAGTTGRPRVFVLGLDADRTSGAPVPDPILDEEIRRAARVAGAPDRRRAHRAAALGARAGARVAARAHHALVRHAAATCRSREVGPSPVLLQAHRLLANEPRRRLRRAARRARRAGLRRAVDDVGLRGRAATPGSAARCDGKRLLDGSAAVVLAMPALAAGLAVTPPGAAPSSRRTTAWCRPPPARSTRAGRARHLAVVARAARQVPAVLVLPAAAWACALPEEPRVRPRRSGSTRGERGSLLHEVFEHFVPRARGRSDELCAPARHGTALERDRGRLRSPSGASACRRPPNRCSRAKRADIRHAARAFLAMEEDAPAAGTTSPGTSPELAFGRRATSVVRAAGRVRRSAIHGRIDRVDQLPGGGCPIIDFKTGSRRRRTVKSPKQGPFNGGRCAAGSHLRRGRRDGARRARCGRSSTGSRP